MEMKKLKFLISTFCLIIFYSAVKAQSTDTLKTKRNEFSFNILEARTSIINENYYGLNFGFKYFPFKNFGAGIFASGFRNDINNNTFGYSIEKPAINFFQAGILLQYDLFRKGIFRFSTNVFNGYASAELEDDATQKVFWTKYGYTKTPEAVASNRYYFFEPGMEFSLRLLGHRRKVPEISLLTKATYRSASGKSRFSSSDNFSGFTFAAGISLGIK